MEFSLEENRRGRLLQEFGGIDFRLFRFRRPAGRTQRQQAKKPPHPARPPQRQAILKMPSDAKIIPPRLRLVLLLILAGEAVQQLLELVLTRSAPDNVTIVTVLYR